MKKNIFAFFLFFLISFNCWAKIEIVACESEWRSLARQIVKDKIDVILAVPANQNPKVVDVRNLSKKITRAELFFCSGGGLESAWLNRIINDGRNIKAVANPQEAILFASDFIDDKLETNLGPRVHLNPHNIIKIADEFTKRIKKVDPLNSNFYQQSYEDFIQRWMEAMTIWEKKAKALKGLTFVANDGSWNHLEKWLEIDIISLDENKSESQSKAIRLNDFAKMLKGKEVRAIIFAGFETKTDLFWLRDKLKLRIIPLPFTVNSVSGSTDLFKVFDMIINRLLADCSSGVCESLFTPDSKTVKFAQ